MDGNTQNLLRCPLPIPGPGASTQLQRGPWQILLERVRGGLVLVSHDGSHSQRHYLGLPDSGSLCLEARAPTHRILVQLTDALALAPGGRLRGYVTVPLPHRVSWLGQDRGCEPLLDFMPRELQTAWSEDSAEGGYVHRTTSAFFVDASAPALGPAALVPLVLQSDCGEVVLPAELPLLLKQGDLREMRGRIVAAPRRLVFDEPDRTRERVRDFPGRP